jgi:hypothetical protein
MTFYHFTCEEHLEAIGSSGVLWPTESNVGSGVPAWEPCGVHLGPDVVWLLDVPTLEYPHGLQGGAFDKTAVRITVGVPAIRWLDWAWTAQMHPVWRAHPHPRGRRR